MTATLLKSFNDYVRKFLEENDVDVESWDSNENQATLKKMVTKVGAKSASAKQSKDPNAPKHQKSAYIFFCEENREKAKKELGPDAKTTEITSHLGAMWKAMKTDSKRVKELNKYNNLALADKERYQKEFNEYTPSEGFKKKRSKKSAAADSIKKPLSAYIFFSNENRAKVKAELGEGNNTVTDVAKQLGIMWKELKKDSSRSEELDRYNNLAAEDKVRYENEKVLSGDSKTKKSGKAPTSEKPATPKAAAKGKAAAAPAKGKAKAAAAPAKGKTKAAGKTKKSVQEEDEEDVLE